LKFRDYAAEESRLTFGPNVVFGGQHYEGILIALREMGFGENFKVNFCGWLHRKHAVRREIWAPTQHLLLTEENRGKS